MCVCVCVCAYVRQRDENFVFLLDCLFTCLMNINLSRLFNAKAILLEEQ